MTTRRARGDRENLVVAIAIEQGRAYANRVQAIIGIGRYAVEAGTWDYVLDPFAGDRLATEKGAYDGVVGRVNRNLADRAASQGIPVVNIWHNCPVIGRVPSVLPDVDSLGPLAADHLLARGFRQFGFLCDAGERQRRPILKGFSRRLAKYGCECSTCLLPKRFLVRSDGWHAAWQAMDKWIGSWKLPIAVFAPYDEYISILQDIARVVHGITAPQELALLGCNNERVICESPGRSISSIDRNYEKVGFEAARLLDCLMAGEPAPAGPITIEPMGLIARGSTDVTVSQDPLIARTLRYLANNCDHALPVRDVAEAMSVPLRTLQRQFSQKLGRNIGQELDYLRLERAKRLLLQSEEPIRIMAKQCGYSGFQQMQRAFRRAEGMTPNQYRKMLKGE